DVSAPGARRTGLVDAGVGRRHADHAQEGTQLHLEAALVACTSGVRVQLPAKEAVRAFADLEPVVEPGRPPRSDGEAELADTNLVDAHLERLPRARVAHLDRPDQCMAFVELCIAWLELLARTDVPARVEAGERDRVAAVDREDRREIRREVAVERAAIERDLVDHARGVPIHASRGARRTRRPVGRLSSRNSDSATGSHWSGCSSRAISAGT